MNEEYIYLTKNLDWKEGLNEEKGYKSDSNHVTKLSEYLFLTKQMGWKNGLKVLGEKGEEATKNKLQ